MANDKHHIDNYFAKELKELDIQAPPEVWGNIEKHLNRRKRGGLITLWTALAAGIAILIGISTYLSTESSTYKSATPQKSLAISKSSASPKTSVSNKPVITEQPNTVSARNIEQKVNSANHHEQQPIVENISKHEPDIDQTVVISSANMAMVDQDKSSEVMSLNEYSPVHSDQAAPLTQGFTTNLVAPLIAQLPTKAENKLILPTTAVPDQAASAETMSIYPEIAENNPTPKIPKWSITGQLAPLYSYRNTNQGSNIGSNQEKGLMAYSGGFKVDYKTSRRFSIQIGIYYDAMGQTVDNIKVATNSDNIRNSAYGNSMSTVVLFTSNSLGPVTSNTGSSGINSGLFYSNVSSDSRNTLLGANSNSGSVTNTQKSGQVSTSDGTMVQKFNFIEVPILARFKIVDKKIGVHMIGGFSTNFLVENYVIFKQDGNTENIGQTSGVNTVNYSSTIGLGISYELFRKIDLSIEPTYKYYIKSLSSNANVDFRPYAFGVFTGFIYKF